MRAEVGDTPIRNVSGFRGEKGERPRATRPGDRPANRPGGRQGHGGGLALWDVADVSAYLRIPVSSIYKMTARRAATRIPHIRIGGTLRFRQTDIDQWLSLLTTSNLEALAKVRQKALKVTHGDHS